MSAMWRVRETGVSQGRAAPGKSRASCGWFLRGPVGFRDVMKAGDIAGLVIHRGERALGGRGCAWGEQEGGNAWPAG